MVADTIINLKKIQNGMEAKLKALEKCKNSMFIFKYNK